ncbi:ATP-binding protein [Streptomyces sp. NBC_01410]|uniref:ATP-binding protein n=1 Tax=Streptomyces sp. NBC_01410 TaxID=2903856 RepID=UPI003248E12D
MGMDRSRPWRKHLPAAAVEHTLPSVQRHIVSVQVAPEAVREARQAVAEHLPKVGIAADSAFADAVLLVASELVANVIRHAAHTPVTDVGITVGAGQLVIAVTEGTLASLASPRTQGVRVCGQSLSSPTCTTAMSARNRPWITTARSCSSGSGFLIQRPQEMQGRE